MNFAERAGSDRGADRLPCRSTDLMAEKRVEYVQTLLEQLSRFVGNKEFRTLSYLIEMAHMEALYIKESTKGSKRLASRKDK